MGTRHFAYIRKLRAGTATQLNSALDAMKAFAAALSTIALFACGPTYAETITNTGNSYSLAAIHKHESGALVFELLNGSEKPIRYIGNDSGRPTFVVEVWSDGAWVRRRVGFICGVGLGEKEIAPKESVSFDVHVPEGKSRVGLQIWAAGYGRIDIWSESPYGI